ncbi:MAG: hypothetical protein ACLSD5_05100 [Eggerthella lenta]
MAAARRLGALLGTAFPADARATPRWRVDARLGRVEAASVEGTGATGRLARALDATGVRVLEVSARPLRQRRRGKSDGIDAEQAAPPPSREPLRADGSRCAETALGAARGRPTPAR